MSTETDPLSDEACKEAYKLYQASAWDSRYDDGVGRDCFTGGWQECARRARDTEKILRDACDEWREAYLREEAENNWLRYELLLIANIGPQQFPESALNNIAERARAALEGK